MARIAIVTAGHLSTSPRVWREADALAAAGHDVIATGVWMDAGHAERDVALLAGRRWAFSAAADFRGSSIRARIARTAARARSRAGRVRVRYNLGDDPHALGYAVDRMERVARRANADLVILHLEPALWIGERLLRDGVRISLDIEDWYSENQQGDAARDPARAHVARLEARVFPAAHASTTISHAMAAALAVHYRMRPPAVVYNSVGREALAAARPLDETLRLLWFSHRLGAGRGLEDLFVALRGLPPRWQLTLLGDADADAQRWVAAQLPGGLADRVQFAPRVPPMALSAVVAAHDVGLALEVPLCRNKDLTASNKIFHYLQCGLLVAASDTAGQREVMAQVPGGGALYPAGDPVALRALLAPWCDAPATVLVGRADRHALANARLAAELQAPPLLGAVEQALAAPRR